MYDYLVSALRCPRCHAVSPATAVTNMQTHLRDDAYGLELAVGYSFEPSDLETKYVLGADYSLIAAPAVAGTMRLLDVWTCPTCRTEQWAVIEITASRIARIEAVSMSRVILESANFISSVNAELLAAALMGTSPAELTERGLNSVEILRQRLE